MDYGEGRFVNGNVVEIIPQAQEPDNWINDQSIWATEDDYNVWNADDRGGTQSGGEPPNKKSRGGDSSQFGGVDPGNRARAIGKMFFKTKLCCKFRNGTCPYITNCNFAHGIEELRKPPPNWQEIVAAQDDERGVSLEPREEHQIPCLISTGVGTESQRSYKGRHCKKFYTEEGCPYGDNCTFLHDEQSKARESVAISLGPSMSNGYGNGVNGQSQKPSNWKTRICNKWEMTGYCPFGSKCHFAHGLGGPTSVFLCKKKEIADGTGQDSCYTVAALLHGIMMIDLIKSVLDSSGKSKNRHRLSRYGREDWCNQQLHRYGGGLVDMEGRDVASAPPDLKQVGVSLKMPMDTVVVSTSSAPHADVYHMGVPSQRSSVINQRPGMRPMQKWKGPDKISRIYGDWIDDNEWDASR
ncbi:hypothetical protein IFM89_032783 [Coptis chinensis]|uniref:C3H1-type domain-containing protein n=1 Tax=Coptis chinensis TaxID=261450 RepID=A0A835J156_9MAGN|nr:hypothetical protein IFM89_032783 [Coptis chinensis]